MFSYFLMNYELQLECCSTAFLSLSLSLSFSLSISLSLSPSLPLSLYLSFFLFLSLSPSLSLSLSPSLPISLSLSISGMVIVPIYFGGGGLVDIVPDCRTRRRLFDSTYRNLDNFVNVTLLISFGRDRKSCGPCYLVFMLMKKKNTQGVNVEDSKRGELYLYPNYVFPLPEV